MGLNNPIAVSLISNIAITADMLFHFLQIYQGDRFFVLLKFLLDLFLN